MTEKPLADIRVLDLTRVLAGPWATQMLADLGAEVIKIERPQSGDDSRGYGPSFLKDVAGRQTRESSIYVAANRNKKSVTVDHAKPEGQDILRRLAARSHVLIENFKVGTLARYGLDYAAIRAINPGIVYCSITGFGQSGPYSHRPGYDIIFQGMTGLMSVTGHRDGTPGEGPQKAGMAIMDLIAGYNAMVAVLAALHRRSRDGDGEYIDLALYDTGVAAMSYIAQEYFISGKPPPRRGTFSTGGVPAQLVRCSDGALVLTAGNDTQFARLCAALGKPELAGDERFATNAGRIPNQFVLSDIMESVFMTRPVVHWLRVLEEFDIPAGPIYDLQEVFADPQVQHRGMAVDVPHALAGTVRLVANPIRYARARGPDYQAPPLLGQHTRAVLGELLDIPPHTLDDLARRGII